MNVEVYIKFTKIFRGGQFVSLLACYTCYTTGSWISQSARLMCKAALYVTEMCDIQ